ncbi:MAG: hypothetical protein HQ488_02480 [Parcubacteria group bacterium]|nr:hypothetical protein [Parcubacteria group bacterium]
METLLLTIYFAVLIISLLIILFKLSKQGFRGFIQKNRWLVLGLIIGVIITYLVPRILSLFTLQEIMYSPWGRIAYLSPGTYLNANIGFMYGFNAAATGGEIPMKLLILLGQLTPLFNALVYAMFFGGLSRLLSQFKKR